MGEGDGMGQAKEEFPEEVPVKSEPGSDSENGPVDDEEKMDQLEILRRELPSPELPARRTLVGRCGLFGCLHRRQPEGVQRIILP